MDDIDMTDGEPQFFFFGGGGVKRSLVRQYYKVIGHMMQLTSTLNEMNLPVRSAHHIIFTSSHVCIPIHITSIRAQFMGKRQSNY